MAGGVGWHGLVMIITMIINVRTEGCWVEFWCTCTYQPTPMQVDHLAS
jgi:hypothetical protein